MKDAFGGIFNLVIVAVFLVLVMGILGLTVNYIKAFKAKNIIISTIEQYGPGTNCFNTGEACFEKIKRETESIGYHPTSLNCPEKKDGKTWDSAPYDDKSNGLFCASLEEWHHETGDSHIDVNDQWKFSIITQVDVDIPIINKIMGLYFFQVKGDTRVITEKYLIKDY